MCDISSCALEAAVCMCSNDDDLIHLVCSFKTGYFYTKNSKWGAQWHKNIDGVCQSKPKRLKSLLTLTVGLTSTTISLHSHALSVVCEGIFHVCLMFGG